MVDTGIRATHVDFGGRVLFGTDTVGDGENGADCFGHGTLVAGIVGGTTYGMAKATTIYNVRTVNCVGTPIASYIVAGLDWVTGNQIKPAVVNMSLQFPGGNTSIDKATRRCIAAGVNVITIAGNFKVDVRNGPSPGPVSPGRISQVITVAASDINDNWASFSDYGPGVSLIAPGVAITSDSPTSDTGAVTEDGTSFAGPHVTGAVARYLQTNPTACQCMVKQAIISNGTLNAISGGPPGTNTPNLLLFAPVSWPTQANLSLSLDGATGYVDVPNGLQGVSLDITGPVTVEAWINVQSEGTRQGIIERYNNAAGTGTNDGGYALRLLKNGKLEFLVLQNGVQFASLTGSITITTGVWHQVAGVYDGSQMRIYVDGLLDTSQPSTFNPVAGTSHLQIGRSADGIGFFSGLVDEARVTGAAVYTGSSFTPAHHITGVPGTVGLWRFDNQTAQDCGLVNNGSLVGGATFSSNVP